MSITLLKSVNKFLYRHSLLDESYHWSVKVAVTVGVLAALGLSFCVLLMVVSNLFSAPEGVEVVLRIVGSAFGYVFFASIVLMVIFLNVFD